MGTFADPATGWRCAYRARTNSFADGDCAGEFCEGSEEAPEAQRPLYSRTGWQPLPVHRPVASCRRRQHRSRCAAFPRWTRRVGELCMGQQAGEYEERQSPAAGSWLEAAEGSAGHSRDARDGLHSKLAQHRRLEPLPERVKDGVRPTWPHSNFSLDNRPRTSIIIHAVSVELSDAFFAKAAGWEAMKRARAMVAAGHVLSSNWSPPVLKGVVQEGDTSYRAGLVIKNSIDIDNLCSCRTSREWGTICAHSVAVGLHYLKIGRASCRER